MFNILLDAAKIVASKEAREGVASLFSALRGSPAWARETVTLEAAFTTVDREPLHLLRDMIAEKLLALEYAPKVCGNFQVVYGELTENVLEHARPTWWRRGRLVADISPTYVGLTVRNPWWVGVDLLRWIDKAKDHLIATKKAARGRGLLMAFRKSDVLEQVGRRAVKAAFYRDHVHLEKTEIDDTTVIVVLSGHSNPSLGRRLIDFMDTVGEAKVVLCLDPKELQTGETRRALEAAGKTLPDFLAAEKKEDEERWNTPSKLIAELLDAITRNPVSRRLVRLVMHDSDVDDLLPKDVVSHSVSQAIKDLKAK